MILLSVIIPASSIINETAEYNLFYVKKLIFLINFDKKKIGDKKEYF